MASLAMQAHQLLCSYAPQFLRQNTRAAWQQDAESFSAWLAAFDETCRAANLLSPARLPLELIPLLESSATTRPSLLLAGFDRIQPSQRRLFDAWAKWQEVSSGPTTREVRYYHAADTQSELSTCALWCKRQLAANPQANLLVITQNLSERRGEIERTFLNFAADENSASPIFEFSLGIPLAQVALARGAHLLLRWLSGPLAEHELDWLLSTAQIAADHEESIALQTYMRLLRRHGLERPQWSLNAFLTAPPRAALPPAWTTRLEQTQTRLAALAARPQSPLDWAELVPQLLDSADWPGARPLSSAELQARHRWQQAVESCASLGFDGRRILWAEFLSILARTLDETLFAPESRDAPIQIAGPAEVRRPHCRCHLVPGRQRGRLARLRRNSSPAAARSSAPSRHAPRHRAARLGTGPRHHTPPALLRARRSVSAMPAKAKASKRGPRASSRSLPALPSRIPAELVPPAVPEATHRPVRRLQPHSLPARQSRRRFQRPHPSVAMPLQGLRHRAPRRAILAARRGRTHPAAARQPAPRRPSLHLGRTAAGHPHPRRTFRPSMIDAAFVADHVARALQQALRPSPSRPHAPPLSRTRRAASRSASSPSGSTTSPPASSSKSPEPKSATPSLSPVSPSISASTASTASTTASLLVIDYKSGMVSPKSWQLPRPDDVQLPLYAGFALGDEEILGGLVFAKVRSGDQSFAGHVGDARATLVPGLDLIEQPGQKQPHRRAAHRLARSTSNN